MLDYRDRADYLDDLSKAFYQFATIDDEIVCIDSKENGIMLNALIVVRGRGITYNVVSLLHKFMKNLDRINNRRYKR